MVSKKNNPFFVLVWNKKSIPRDHCLSSLSKPRDKDGDPQNRVFYPTLTLMINSYRGIYMYLRSSRKSQIFIVMLVAFCSSLL